jgi:hypothetical protein
MTNKTLENNHTMSFQSKLDALEAARKQQDGESLGELIQHPRCAILPSPDKLNTATSPGEDALIKTRADFDKVWRWLTSSDFLKLDFTGMLNKLLIKVNSYKM